MIRIGTLFVVDGEGDPWIGGTYRQLWASVLSAFVPQKLTAVGVTEHASELSMMDGLAAGGRVTPVLGPASPLADGATAVAASELGNTDGGMTISTRTGSVSDCARPPRLPPQTAKQNSSR